MADDGGAEVIDLTQSGSESSDHGDADGSMHSGSSEEDALGDSDREELQKAIATVPEARLRGTLARLALTDRAVELALFTELVGAQPGTGEAIPRWQTCENCDEEFDASTERVDGECMCHPGVLEVDEESFVDWDEDCHGPMDSSQNRREYPENFMWTCCDNDGTSIGCVRGTHSSPENARKRRRL